MTLNGEHVADSQICLEFLARKFNKNFSGHLTPEEQAVSRAMQIMAEEHLLWYIQIKCQCVTGSMN